MGNSAHARDARERERQSAYRKRLRPTAPICRQGVRGTVYGLRAAAARRLAFDMRDLRAKSLAPLGCDPKRICGRSADAIPKSVPIDFGEGALPR